MKISVITVAYNAAKTIRATMESVAAQRGVEVEHLVIDGGSTDGTMEIVRGFPCRALSERDQGMYDALNKGIALATGEVIGILNADDVFDGEDALKAVAAAFAEGGADLEAVYADVRFVREGRTVRYYSARAWKPWMARWGFMMPHPGVYIRRGVFARLGGYRLGYRISADFELMTRYFVKGGVRAAYLPRSLVRMLPGGMSTSGLKAMVVLNRENVRALRENGIYSNFLMMLPKYFYKVLGLFARWAP